MSSRLTLKGQEAALFGTATPNGGLANIAAKLKLYTNASVPAVDGTGFTEVANGNGYTTGGVAITRADWTLELNAGNNRIRLSDKVWTAAGGSIANVAGAYITDAADNVLAWFERSSAVTISSGDTFTLKDLAIKALG